MAFKEMHKRCSSCNSSDALCVNDDGSTKCFSCGTYQRPSEALNGVQATYPSTTSKKGVSAPSDAFVGPIVSRRLSVSTVNRYGVLQDTDNTLYFPYYEKETLTAFKRKTEDKQFKFIGNAGDSLLFGMNCFSKGGKHLTITEGELDALAVYQMLGSKSAVISIKNGAQSALTDCKKHFEWIDSFETITLVFDNDDPGREATKKVAELFGNKARLFKHAADYKDGCDWLGDKQEMEFLNRWEKAERYKPEGVVTVKDIKERLLTPPEPGVAWCFPTLTDLTYGRRKGELYAFGAGVGVGKTDVFTQQIAYDMQVLQKRVGVIYLEQNVVETATRVAGKLDGRLYHVPDGEWTREQFVSSIDRLEQQQRLFMFEHFGAMEWAIIKNIIRYFNKAYDIDHIYLDHLTALSANEQDERRALDGIMADMASLAQELGVVIHFISHLTTPDGKPHEEGGRVMEKHFTGSRAIARWSHYMFGLERDKQAEDPVARQTTTFRVLKDRFTGRATAAKFGLLYNQQSGLLTETVLIEDEGL